MVQNYAKIVYIKSSFENGWKEDAYPSSYPPGSAPGHKVVLDKNHQNSLAYFSHLAPLILFFSTKRQIQKGEKGMAQCYPSPLLTLLHLTIRFIQERIQKVLVRVCNSEFG